MDRLLEPKRGRGRPKGSKNKEKIQKMSEEVFNKWIEFNKLQGHEYLVDQTIFGPLKDQYHVFRRVTDTELIQIFREYFNVGE